jgi:RimJ/RimL family protein N-acetyltransferase
MMLHRLKPEECNRVLPLLEGLDHLLLLQAVLAGTAPGYVCADDPYRPRALFASGPEGHYLLGDPDADGFRDALAGYIRDELLPGARTRGWAEVTLYYEPAWAEHIEALLPRQPLVYSRQRYFQWQGPLPDWRATLPDDVVATPIDAALLAREDLRNREWVVEFATSDYADEEAFLAHGSGMCLVRDNAALSWCTTDCIVDSRAEVGIATMPHLRRQGLGGAVAVAAVEMLQGRGISGIGWHCWEQNLASAATARKAGFVEQYSHEAVFLWLNPVDGILVRGNLALMAGEHAAAADHYQQAFALWAETREEATPTLLKTWAAQATYRYQAACAAALAGDVDGSREQLEAAWSYGGYRQGGA